MNKLRKATKRIAAIAASAAMVSSAVFGAGLSTYPNNFVKNGKFVGQVVVGSTADAMDSTSASSVIEDLKAEFSGSSEKVVITYKKSGSGGEELNAVRSNNELNYGENLGDVTEQSGFDSRDIDVLADGRFRNGVSDEDYEQLLYVAYDKTTGFGKFNYALRDKVEDVRDIVDGVYFEYDDVFAMYELSLKTAITGTLTTSANKDDFIGQELIIMGNEFTVGDIAFTGNNLDKLVLLGGANKISLGEGESTKVSMDGKDYDIAVMSVSDTKVLLTINGQSRSISEYDTEEVSGITVAVTDLVSSSRDAVKGYAEIVVGGNKVELLDGNKLVKVNNEKINDMFEGYEIWSDFTGSGIDTIQITYKVKDDTLLQKGEHLEDVLFQSFRLVYEGTNEPKYSTVEVRVNDEDVKVSGKTIRGESFSRDLIHLGAKTAADSIVYFKGNRAGDRTFFRNSEDFTAGTTGTVGDLAAALLDGTAPTFDLTSANTRGSGFLLSKDNDEQYMFEIRTLDTSDVDKEIDFLEYLRGGGKDDIKESQWETKLAWGVTGLLDGTSAPTNKILNVTKLGNLIGFENDLLLDLTNAETIDISATTPKFVFKLDSADTRGDSATDDQQQVRVEFDLDTTDDEFMIKGVSSLDSTGTLATFANAGFENNEYRNSDRKTYVDVFGTKVEFDNKDKEFVRIMVPEEQVRANVKLVFGAASDSYTVTVDADKVDSKKSELKADGYTVVKEEKLSAEAITFDVKSAVLDTQVSGSSDMIVVGGPAINSVARSLLGINTYTIDQAGVSENEGVIRYFSDKNSVLVYGYSAKDTSAAVKKLNAGSLSGDRVNVQ